MTAVDLDALDAARAAATPGWNLVGGTHDRTVIDGRGLHVCETFLSSDAALIVAAVNALPELVADARKLRALREAVEGLARKWLRDGSAPTQAIELRAVLAAAVTSEGERE